MEEIIFPETSPVLGRVARSVGACIWTRAPGHVVPCSKLVAVALLLPLTLGSLYANLFVVLLKGSQVLAGLRELALFHALSNIPVHEGPLRVHEVELMVDA